MSKMLFFQHLFIKTKSAHFCSLATWETSAEAQAYLDYQLESFLASMLTCYRSYMPLSVPGSIVCFILEYAQICQASCIKKA